jgi:hypothetical protein
MLKMLTPREERIIKMRFGLEDGSEHTLKEGLRAEISFVGDRETIGISSSNRDAVWPTATQPPLSLCSRAGNKQRAHRMKCPPLVIRLSLARPVSMHPSRGFWRRRDSHFLSLQVQPATVDQDSRYAHEQ